MNDLVKNDWGSDPDSTIRRLNTIAMDLQTLCDNQAVEIAWMRAFNTDAEAQIAQLREVAKSYKGDAIDTLAKLREAVEVIRPFAAISREGVVTTKTGHVRLTTCAEYFHEADAFLASIDAERATMEQREAEKTDD